MSQRTREERKRLFRRMVKETLYLAAFLEARRRQDGRLVPDDDWAKDAFEWALEAYSQQLCDDGFKADVCAVVQKERAKPEHWARRVDAAESTWKRVSAGHLDA